MKRAKRRPRLKRRAPSLLDVILKDVASHNPALRAFLNFDVRKLHSFKPHRAHTPAWLKP